MANSLFAKDVIFLGRMEMKDLAQIYGASFALMYVSYFEGFGIPIVEAMYAETPIITSSTTSMPEVAGDAGLIADPADYLDIADCMMRLYDDPELRATLIEKGIERRKIFNWDISAKRVMESIIKGVNSSY